MGGALAGHPDPVEYVLLYPAARPAEEVEPDDGVQRPGEPDDEAGHPYEEGVVVDACEADGRRDDDDEASARLGEYGRYLVDEEPVPRLVLEELLLVGELGEQEEGYRLLLLVRQARGPVHPRVVADDAALAGLEDLEGEADAEQAVEEGQDGDLQPVDLHGVRVHPSPGEELAPEVGVPLLRLREVDELVRDLPRELVGQPLVDGGRLELRSER